MASDGAVPGVVGSTVGVADETQTRATLSRHIGDAPESHFWEPPSAKADVLGYLCVRKRAHYGQAHHSQADTFDKVIPDQINEGAALLAAWAWNVSEMPASLPHHPASTSNDTF